MVKPNALVRQYQAERQQLLRTISELLAGDARPRSLAAFPNQARLIFDRAGLRRSGKPFYIPERQIRQETAERPLHYASFFWMMLLIAAKQIYRHPRADEMELLPYLLQPLEKVQSFVGQERRSEGGERTSLIPRPFSPRGGERRGADPPPSRPGKGARHSDAGGLGLRIRGQNGKEHNRPRSPGEKIRLLRQLADQMSRLMAALAERGEAVPVAIIPGADRYLKMVAAALEAAGPQSH